MQQFNLILDRCANLNTVSTVFVSNKYILTYSKHHALVRVSSDLRFYQQVKLVNFIRRQIHQSRCYGCQEKFDSRADVLRHIATEGHIMKLPETSTWDQPQ